jgi:hypothetical protein
LRFYCIDVILAEKSRVIFCFFCQNDDGKIFGLFINCRKDDLSQPSDFEMSVALGSVRVHQKMIKVGNQMKTLSRALMASYNREQKILKSERKRNNVEGP